MTASRSPARHGNAGSRVGLLQVSAAGVLWGTGGLVVTLLHERTGLGAMTTSAWRMALAAVALVAFAAVTGRLGAARRTVREHLGLTVALGCGTALYQGLYFVSVLLVGVSVATVVSLGVAPVLAAAWEHLARRTRPTWRQVGVLAAALAGLVLVTAAAPHGTTAPVDRPALGVALAVASGATYAATTVLGHRLAQRVDPVALTTGATVVGALALAPFLVVAGALGEPVLATDPTSLGLLVYLGVATMALSYGLLYAGLRTTTGSAATVATLVEPLTAATLAAAVLGERLAWPALVGGALVLAAVAALRTEDASPRRARRRPGRGRPARMAP
ncbi:DMT family transporter [Cellulomonas carbonis]|uniref:Multidrug DMT transporter permease n=1 Tax=Cellulomonas carbonis T26 TaxID=947969 RepID=A0A0A0BT18_9CELL|nr:DMT family transporter [Cellulomonas carbonis]KGM11583.1 multidrug DMT transporter permease [Cellulomonas carbonis T26]GGC06851.1 membrane protein [Cellulomonas carbonis]